MGEKPQSSIHLRPVDLARGHGLSTQAVRNYEAEGILPPAERTPHGYRTYTPRHAAALRAFLALLPGHGHQRATSIMRAVNRAEVEAAFHLIDQSHAQLLDDRRTLQAVERALRDLEPRTPRPDPTSQEPGSTAPPETTVLSGLTTVADSERRGSRNRPPGSSAPQHRPSGNRAPGNTFIGPLAERLGIRPATLRKWERAGLVHPHRDPRTGYRVYDQAAVRDAQLVHQLRRGNYLLDQIAPLITQVRSAGGLQPLETMLGDWHRRLGARGRALLAGAAQLEAYLDEHP